MIVKRALAHLLTADADYLISGDIFFIFFGVGFIEFLNSHAKWLSWWKLCLVSEAWEL